MGDHETIATGRQQARRLKRTVMRTLCRLLFGRQRQDASGAVRALTGRNTYGLSEARKIALNLRTAGQAANILADRPPGSMDHPIAETGPLHAISIDKKHSPGIAPGSTKEFGPTLRPGQNIYFSALKPVGATPNVRSLTRQHLRETPEKSIGLCPFPFPFQIWFDGDAVRARSASRRRRGGI
jgi:hypothetical protein